MVAPESEQPTSSCGSQKFGPNLSSSQHSDSPRHISSTSDLQTLDNSCQNEPREYTETDFLLPDKLYGRSRLSEAIAAKEAVRSDAPAESVCSMLLQILVPFLLAGLGTVSAGMLLDVVQVKRRTQNADWQFHCESCSTESKQYNLKRVFHFWQNWDVFQEVTEIFILVPAVLGMKGNLEMTLASRLSTAVSVCNLAHRTESTSYHNTHWK